MRVRPCISCKNPLESAIGDTPEQLEQNQPWGTTFSTRGNYGSTVIDNDGRTFEINLCDLCLTEAINQGMVRIIEGEVIEGQLRTFQSDQTVAGVRVITRTYVYDQR